MTLADTTLPEPDDTPSSERNFPEAFALVILWSRDEPWRVGEVAFVPASGSKHWVTVGRGASEGTQPSRALFGQQRPGQWLPAPPLESRTISRRQLVLCERDDSHLKVENTGRLPLLVNGREVSEIEIGPGELLQIGRQLLLCAVRRPVQLQLGPAPDDRFPFGEPDAYGIVGESPAIWRLRAQVRSLGSRTGHVLITGPSGVGKELVARAIHVLSFGQRALVARNAATLPESLIDAELFGNLKNYPNPGAADRPGLIGQAHETSLFLDELGELPFSAQAHLLRVLDSGEYQRLGESHARTSRFRLIGATNRDPGVLKPDFAARFAFRLSVPDLRARREDIPLLVRHILRSRAASGDDLARRRKPSGDPDAEPRLPLELIRDLVTHDYSANTRELEARILAALATPGLGLPRASPSLVLPSADGGAQDQPHARDSELTPERIQRALDEHNGAIEKAFRALGLPSRFALLRLIKKHGLSITRRPRRTLGKDAPDR